MFLYGAQQMMDRYWVFKRWHLSLLNAATLATAAATPATSYSRHFRSPRTVTVVLSVVHYSHHIIYD